MRYWNLYCNFCLGLLEEVWCGIFDKMALLDTLPTVILNIIMTYKRDLELLSQIPSPYDKICTHIPYKLYGGFTTTDFLILHIMELVNRLDLRDVSFDQLISTPHTAIIAFETANHLHRKRLELYGLTFSPPLNPCWSYSLPYLIIEYITTSDVFQLS